MSGKAATGAPRKAPAERKAPDRAACTREYHSHFFRDRKFILKMTPIRDKQIENCCSKDDSPILPRYSIRPG